MRDGKGLENRRWVPHELNDRQMENRKNTCAILLAWYKRKSFLHSIVTGDGKWISFNNPKRTIHIDRKAESFWQKDDSQCLVGQRHEAYYEPFKSGETVNTKRY